MKTPKILKSIKENRICYFQSSINYTILCLENGKTIISGYNIKVFEAIYSQQNFIKINRSKLVNVAFIKKTIVENNACSIQLFDGNQMPVSRRRFNQLKENYPYLF
jgi:DNA-binding LytR/AlgR family response regulator